jgi:hypothetical protein
LVPLALLPPLEAEVGLVVFPVEPPEDDPPLLEDDEVGLVVLPVEPPEDDPPPEPAADVGAVVFPASTPPIGPRATSVTGVDG